MEKVVSKQKPQALIVAKSEIISISLCLSGFFIGRITMLDFLSPVGIAYLATFSAISKNLRYYLTAVFIALGFLSKLQGDFLFKYVLAIVLVVLPNAIIHLKIIAGYRLVLQKTWVQSSIAAISIFLANSILIFQDGFSVYFTLIAFMEAFFVLALTFILKKSTFILLGQKKRRFLSNEEIISLSLLVGCIIAGSSDIFIGTLSMKYLFVVPVLLYAAIRFGPASAACAGLMLGVILYLSENALMSLPILLAVSALSAGLCRSFGRLGVMLGFVFSMAFFSFMIEPSILNQQLLISVAGGLLIFLLIPLDFNVFTAINPTTDNSSEYLAKIKILTSQKLVDFSRAFEKLSRTFSRLSEKKTGLDQKDITVIIDKVCEKICESCPKCKTCWEVDYYATYKMIFALLEACEKNGAADENMMYNCRNALRFTDLLIKLYELSKSNLSWQNKILESRELVAQQLLGVSDIMKKMSGEIDFNLNFKEELSDMLSDELKKNKFEVENVILLENKRGKYELTLNHKPCYGKKACSREIGPIVEQLLKRKLKASEDCIFNKGRCYLRLVEEQNYRVTGGIARASKSGSKESGDSFSIMELKDGQCLLVLSDGMGSGKRAKDESTAVVELLEEFIESGFEKDLAIKMINSVLLLRGNDECFSTLDICSIDLYSGDAEFIKIGASTTFLLRGKIVEPIRSSSLPIGIVNDLELDVSMKKLHNNDYIIMVTDGADLLNDASRDQSWITQSLMKFTGSHPQELSDFLLNEALSMFGDNIQDDITILSAKIWTR